MSSKVRNRSIDLFKGILLILMIVSHILQLLFFPNNILTFNKFVNLITFSGFMFSFGYVTYFAYISKDIDKKTLRNKMTKRFLITIIAFYISSLAYQYFINNYISFDVILDIIFFRSIAGYSEFLLSFAFIYILIYLFKNIFNKMNNKLLILMIIVSLLTTYFNYELVNNNIIGVLIGTTEFACFPIIQYLCYYILGLFIAKNKIKFNKVILSLSLISSIIFNIYIIINGNSPDRFPPAIHYILGGFFWVYILYLICTKIKENRITNYIQNMGNNTLIYLVISNVIIFYFKRLMLMYGIFFDKTLEYFFITLFIFMLCVILSYLYIIIKKYYKHKIKTTKKYINEHLFNIYIDKINIKML